MIILKMSIIWPLKLLQRNRKHREWKHHKLAWQDRKALKQVIKATQNIIDKHLLSIDDVSAQSPKHTKGPLDHPAPIWLKIQKYPLWYNQTTEQLLSSDCDSSELILHTPPDINSSYYIYIYI